MRTVSWNYETNQVEMIDQRLLPAVFEIATFDDFRQVAHAITEMVVRGAPAIGAAAGITAAVLLYAIYSFARVERSFADII